MRLTCLFAYFDRVLFLHSTFKSQRVPDSLFTDPNNICSDVA